MRAQMSQLQNETQNAVLVNNSEIHKHQKRLEKLRVNAFKSEIDREKAEGGWRAEVIRTERVGNTPIIHWLPDNMAQPAVLLLEEEGELVTAQGLLETNDYPDGTIVQLERMGFAILEGVEDDGVRRLVRLHG